MTGFHALIEGFKKYLKEKNKEHSKKSGTKSVVTIMPIRNMEGRHKIS